jgi:hypothetical protein
MQNERSTKTGNKRMPRARPATKSCGRESRKLFFATQSRAARALAVASTNEDEMEYCSIPEKTFRWYLGPAIELFVT